MDTNALFSSYFGVMRLTLANGQLSERLADGTLRPVLNAPRVTMGELLAKDSNSSASGLEICRFQLSPIEDPFWLSLFSFFQSSGFSVHIEDNGVLRITTFGGVFGTTFWIANNCVSLSNSTYQHYRNVAMKMAKEQDQEGLLREFRGGDSTADGGSKFGQTA